MIGMLMIFIIMPREIGHDIGQLNSHFRGKFF